MSRKEKKNNGFIFVIIIIIVLGVIVGISMKNKPGVLDNKNETISNEIATNTQDIKKNEIENENKELENKQVDNNSESQKTETFTESPKSDGEKAIDIVKKAYGEGKGITFEIANWDDGKGRIIVVVNKETDIGVKALFYHVDVAKGEYEIQY